MPPPSLPSSFPPSGELRQRHLPLPAAHGAQPHPLRCPLQPHPGACSREGGGAWGPGGGWHSDGRLPPPCDAPPPLRPFRAAGRLDDVPLYFTLTPPKVTALPPSCVRSASPPGRAAGRCTAVLHARGDGVPQGDHGARLPLLQGPVQQVWGKCGIFSRREPPSRQLYRHTGCVCTASPFHPALNCLRPWLIYIQHCTVCERPGAAPPPCTTHLHSCHPLPPPCLPAGTSMTPAKPSRSSTSRALTPSGAPRPSCTWWRST